MDERGRWLKSKNDGCIPRFDIQEQKGKRATCCTILQYVILHYFSVNRL